jgi:hypothetical protein
MKYGIITFLLLLGLVVMYGTAKIISWLVALWIN